MLDTTILDQVTQEFLTALRQDASAVQHAASSLFYYLAVIQLSLTAIWSVLEGASLEKLLIKFVQLAFTLGFFYALIQKGGQWIPQLLNGFIQIGQQGGVQSLDPSSIIDQGASIAGGIFKAFFGWGLLNHLFVAMVGSVVCIAIIILYALMAAELAILLVKSYIVIALSSLFFALGGSDYTRAMATNYVQAAIGLGLKLMSLYLLLGVGVHVGADWATITANAAKHHAITPMLVILAAVIVYYMILKNVPSFIAGLSGIGGFNNMGDAAVATAINAGTSGASALMQSKLLAIKSMESAKVGRQGLAHIANAFTAGSNISPQGGSGQSKPLWQGAKTASRAFASATANTVKNTVLHQNAHLSTGQKFNAHMQPKVKAAQKAANQKPSPFKHC